LRYSDFVNILLLFPQRKILIECIITFIIRFVRFAVLNIVDVVVVVVAVAAGPRFIFLVTGIVGC